ncbi:Potassium voltage-gated channel subfamily B member 2 [Phytophthora nicotianae]|uniref:Lipase maturation factor 2 n=1 Tax=Phytophthora nicotianae TaxID=4792 RepID=A0A0W8DIT8_PHYNI|nr:Potassium voltage-gated channel subfamily B member 2 [Phytophthora nicotianae]
MLRFPREFFLICICTVYALAFASIRTQVRGLYGENGIQPVDVYLRSVKVGNASESHGVSTFEWIADKFPTLVWLHEPFQWTPSFCMEVICLAGVTIALLGMVQPAWRTTGPLTLLWICYLSIVKCGQTFMQFQWDSFLLEIGVLAVLMAPWWHRGKPDDTFETPAAAVWTLRFLFFKFMLMSGAVKIQSRCPTWLGLTALDFHFATQPLPLPLSWYALQAPYRITSAYGLFRTMTGVGTVKMANEQHVSVVARPEIILEGTEDGGLTWKSYHFKYKPGDLSSAPRLIAPFQPRLDWQMWFAALGDYHSAPWLVNLVAKLLEGSRDVKELLDTTRDPFPDAPPDAIRAQLYYYDFTRLNTSWNQALPTAKILNYNDTQWWTRTFVKEYLPALERGNPSLTAFVEHHWPSTGARLSSETNEASKLRQWVDRGLGWLCNTSWSPVGLAAGGVLAQSGVAAMFRTRRRAMLTKLKIQ